MLATLLTTIADALGIQLPFGLGTESRLFHLEAAGSAAAVAEQLLVEAWWMREALDDLFECEVVALSALPIDLDALLGQTLRLRTTLANGSSSYRSGFVSAVETLDADGGLHRHRLTLSPWPWLLDRMRGSAVWQERAFTEVIDDVLGAAQGVSQWVWSPDVGAFLADGNGGGLRSHVAQYRETPWRFVQRLLADEGIGLRFEEDDGAPQRHRAVLFADSASADACPEDASSASGGGVRYHRASSQEDSDAIQAFGPAHELHAANSTVLSWDYKAKRAVAATAPSASLPWHPDAPALEDYDVPGAYAFSDASAAERHARLRREAAECRQRRHIGRSTVRSFRAGTTFRLTQGVLDLFNGDARYLLTAVTHAGVNNLPVEMQRALAARWWHSNAAADLLPEQLDRELVAQARATGYGNRFEAIDALTPWRPRRVSKPVAPGVQTAIVTGPAGETSPGAEEIHCDALGRIKVAFHWQRGERADDRNTCWLRVAQAYAGAGYGAQHLPRIGQEVLIGFVEGDIDRPVVRGALYNGQGDGGVPATPGGEPAATDAGAFDQGADHCPSGQGNATAGNAPAWHGAAGDAHAHAAALSGTKTKEFNGSGYNQLVFDDTDGQLRTQFGTTQYATWLSLGHLLHQADNRRGSFRGLGAELRTDAWGALRAAQGLLLTTYGADPSDPAGDNTAARALMQQLTQLADTFNQAARTHQTVQLAGHIGSTQANASALNDKQAPLQALKRSLDGMVSGAEMDQALTDATNRNTSPSGKLPHAADPVIAVSARAGIALTAQDAVFGANDTLHLASGQDHTRAVTGAAKVHTGQAIGVLAGAIQPGTEAAGTGLSLIAGHGDVQLQAQSDQMQIAAKQLLNVQSANGHIEWAAAKKITLKTADGACIEISDAGITVQCPGTIEVKAAQRAMEGGARQDYLLPLMPHQVCIECLLNAAAQGSPFAMRG